MNKIKIALPLFMSLLLTYSTNAQVGDAIDLVAGLIGDQTPQVVVDPTSKAQTAELLMETKKNADLVNKQIELLKEAKEKIDIVNKNLKQVQYLQDIILIEQRLFMMSQETLNMAKDLDILYHKRVIAAINGFNGVTIALGGTLELVNGLLTDNLFDLSTGERLKLLRDYKIEAMGHLSTARELQRLVIEVGTLRTLNRAYGRIESRNTRIIGN
ncbi:MAG: hypothetical protein RLO12_01915 [Fulvivirga sp.]